MRDRWFIESTGVRVVVLTIAILLTSRLSPGGTISSIDQWIDDLGSTEARVRDDAAENLRQAGEPARLALRRATDHPVPEVSVRARGLLGRLPFYIASDSPEVKACLFDYELDDESGRGRRIDRLATVKGPDASRALARIVLDEPARSLRWKAVGFFASCVDDAVLAEVRDLQNGTGDPARLALSASGWRATDPERARKLLRHAVESDLASAQAQSEMAVQLLPLLKSLRMQDETRRLFEAGYRPLLTDLADSPADAARMIRLALYCLHCDEHLPHALDLSTRALATEPTNPHFLDTLAQVHFRMGRTDEAVRLEEKALRIRPFDQGIEQRLEQFLAAVE